jgi:hypothetical protein
MSCCLWMGAHVLVLMATATLAKATRWRQGPGSHTAQSWRLSHDHMHLRAPSHHVKSHTQP